MSNQDKDMRGLLKRPEGDTPVFPLYANEGDDDGRNDQYPDTPPDTGAEWDTTVSGAQDATVMQEPQPPTYKQYVLWVMLGMKGAANG